MRIYIVMILLLAAVTQVAAQRIGNLDGINYQAVALDEDGEEIVGIDLDDQPLYEKSIDVRFSILQGNDGPVQYQESHTTTTDQNGMFALVIGQGELTGQGLFDRLLDVPWIDANQWLQVELAVEGGDYRRVSLEKFQTVPYSFYTDDIADNAITTEKILNEEVLSEDIANETILSEDILNETILSEDISNGTILNEDIADNTINLTEKVIDTLAISNGGTGRGEIPQGDIVVGNGAEPLTSLSITDSVMVFSNKGGSTELYKLVPGPRTSISVDETTNTVTITALQQTGTNVSGEQVSVPNIAPGEQVERNFPSAGVQPGDIILATIDQDLQGVTVSAYVRIAGQVRVIFFNGSNQAVDLGPVTVNFANFGQP